MPANVTVCCSSFSVLRNKKVSELRQKWERADVINAVILRFARTFYGSRYRFLTLSTGKHEGRSLRLRKQVFFKVLRSFDSSLEYRSVNTDEGCGVSHVCLITKFYFPQAWLKDLWGARVSITLEKDLGGLVKEMSLQKKIVGYSMSRGFLPDGSRKALDYLSLPFRGRLLFKAVDMLALRWKRPDALYRTIECCSRKDGWCCDLRHHFEILGGRCYG
jgi:hypothetical protein